MSTWLKLNSNLGGDLGLCLGLHMRHLLDLTIRLDLNLCTDLSLRLGLNLSMGLELELGLRWSNSGHHRGDW